MKTGRQHTRDRHEDRCERQEKLGQALDTLPGKTLRDRTPASRTKVQRPTPPRVSVEVAAVSKLPLTTSEPAAETHRTSFRLYAPFAQSVQLAGTFNDWRPGTTPLSPGSDGEWETGVPLKPGTYEYRFVVDGKWQEDPMACESAENPYCSRNSIKHVGE